MTQTATGDEIPATHGKQPAFADEINNRRSEMTIDGKSVASKGLGGTALGLGIGALGVELLNGGLNGILGWGRGNNAGEVAAAMSAAALMAANGGCRSHCEDDQPITRYEMRQEKELAAKDSEIALLKSERFTDAKILEASNVLLGRIQNIEARLGAIDVQPDSELRMQPQRTRGVRPAGTRQRPRVPQGGGKMVTLEQVKKGAETFCAKEIEHKLPLSKAFLFGTAAGVMFAKFDALAEWVRSKPLVSALGIVSDDGEIDDDTLFAAMRTQAEMGNASFDIPIIGNITFSGEDVDKLHQYIRSAR
ncbi:MAG: hypothetical protein NC489_18305 [Ruminococcus flavefaciens]|nr:hypothetical protein [Ruminococcus flavefaciens]